MTPTQDARARRNAQRAYDFATAELAQFECPEGTNYMTWLDSPEYRQSREYREWLHTVQRHADYRRRHPIVRRLKDSQYIGRAPRGEYGEPTARFGWHWQNLDEDLIRRPSSPQFMGLGLPDLRHQGRAWFDWYVRWSDTRPLKIEAEWSTGKAVWSSGVSYSRRNSGTVTLHASIRPIVSVYLILKHIWPRRKNQPARTYSISVSAEDLTLHYDLGKPGSGDEWHRDDPLNWMRGCRFLMDDIFGRSAYAKEKLGPPVQAVACFPEGQYTLTLQRETSTWTRPRWPWPYVRHSVDISLERPPQFEGKGENSWDLGPDAIYGMSSEGHSFEDAVAAYTKAVLRERRKRGHLNPEHRSVRAEVER
jgi:hypothetical protein